MAFFVEPINESLLYLGRNTISWIEIDMTEVSADNEVLPEGRKFNFELLAGAKPSKFNENRTEVAAKVADGEFANRIIYYSYPAPQEQPWVVGVVKRFEKIATAQGFEEMQPGEELYKYLNRIAGTKFVSSIKHRPVDSDGVTTVKAELKIGNVEPVK